MQQFENCEFEFEKVNFSVCYNYINIKQEVQLEKTSVCRTLTRNIFAKFFKNIFRVAN